MMKMMKFYDLFAYFSDWWL